MKYCPECESEYYDEVEKCADCGTTLIWEEEFIRRKKQEELEKESLLRKKFVPVKTVENSFEADRIKDALEQEGILVIVRTFSDRAYSGIYATQKGWGWVAVPESDKSRAEHIINELFRVFPVEGGKEEE